MRIRRRHDIVRVRRDDALPELALIEIARDDRGSALGGLLEEAFLRIKTQVRLARLGVGAMAGGAVVGEDGPDVAVEADLGLGGVGQTETSD